VHVVVDCEAVGHINHAKNVIIGYKIGYKPANQERIFLCRHHPHYVERDV